MGAFTGWLVRTALDDAESNPSGSLLEGVADTIFLPGRIDTVKVPIVKNESFYLKPANTRQDSSLFEKTLMLDNPSERPLETSSAEIHLAITTYPAADSIKLNFLSKIEARELFRTDTLMIFRVDTLKINVPEPTAFYDNFETGFGVAASLIAIILFLIK